MNAKKKHNNANVGTTNCVDFATSTQNILQCPINHKLRYSFKFGYVRPTSRQLIFAQTDAFTNLTESNKTAHEKQAPRQFMKITEEKA